MGGGGFGSPSSDSCEPLGRCVGSGATMRGRVWLLVGVAIGVIVGGGGAFAASRYLITSANQIKPSVRAQLRGNRGARGPRGPRGLPGVQGQQGLQGKQGTP